MSIDSPQNAASLEYLSSALLRTQQQSVPQSKYAQLLAVLEEMGRFCTLI